MRDEGQGGLSGTPPYNHHETRVTRAAYSYIGRRSMSNLPWSWNINFCLD